MLVNVSEAEGDVLNWLVAKAQKCPVSDSDLVRLVKTMDSYQYCTDPRASHPIIEEEGIWTRTTDEGEDDPSCKWRAELPYRSVEVGPTALVAATRCFVHSRMGETVEVPEELVESSGLQAARQAQRG